MTIVPFKIEHFDCMELPSTSMRAYRDRFIQYAQMGMAVTLLDACNQPIACGGIIVHWQGVGEIWMIPSKHTANHPVSVCRVGRYVMDYAINELNLRRIQATVDENDVTGINYVEQYSFGLEGRLRQCGPNGENYLLYARIIDHVGH